MKNRAIIGGSLRWIGLLAAIGLLTYRTLEAQVRPSPSSPVVEATRPTPDQTRAMAQALVVELTDLVHAQRAQLLQTEASLERARALLQALGGSAATPPAATGNMPPLPDDGRSPFDLDHRAVAPEVAPPPAVPHRQVNPPPGAPVVPSPSLPVPRGPDR